MSTEIAIPFQLDKGGRIATVTNPNEQISQHVKSLVGTEPGERVMMSSYGVPLKQYLFEPGDSQVTAVITTSIQTAMSAWEPGLVVDDIEPVPNVDGDGISSVEVHYTRAGAPNSPVVDISPSKTAIIRVGGKVVPE